MTTQLQSVPTLQRPTLSAQVARHLLDLIAREGLKPGDTAPSEVQICRDLEVSRGSVREAYRTRPRSESLKSRAGAARACRRSAPTCWRRSSVTH